MPMNETATKQPTAQRNMGISIHQQLLMYVKIPVTKIPAFCWTAF